MTDQYEHKKISRKQADGFSSSASYLLMGAGSMFTSMLIASFIVGYMLDQVFDTTPLFFLGCAVLGFIGGVQKVHQLTKCLNQVPEKKTSEANGDKES